MFSEFGEQIYHRDKGNITISPKDISTSISRVTDSLYPAGKGSEEGVSIYFNGRKFGRIRVDVEVQHRPDRHYFIYFFEMENPDDPFSIIGFDINRRNLSGYEKRIVDGQIQTSPRDISLEEASSMVEKIPIFPLNLENNQTS